MGLFDKIKQSKEKKKTELLFYRACYDHKSDQYELAKRYSSGNGFEQSAEKAFEWYSRAVQFRIDTIDNQSVCQQAIDAWYELGNCFWNGNGVKKNEYLAFLCYRYFGREGDGPITQTLDEFNSKQKECLKMLISAMLEQQDSTSPDTLYCLGHIFSDYKYGYADLLPITDEQKLRNTAFSFYHRASELGSADALFRTSDYIEDVSKRLEIIKRAADKGSAIAQVKLAELYRGREEGTFPIQTSDEMAVRYYTLAANNTEINGTNSQAEAQKWLGLMAEDIGNKELAISWYQKHLEIRANPWYHLDSNLFGYIGNLYKEMGNRTQALSWYNKGIEYNNDVECRSGLRYMH